MLQSVGLNDPVRSVQIRRLSIEESTALLLQREADKAPEFGAPSLFTPFVWVTDLSRVYNFIHTIVISRADWSPSATSTRALLYSFLYPSDGKTSESSGAEP